QRKLSLPHAKLNPPQAELYPPRGKLYPDEARFNPERGGSNPERGGLNPEQGIFDLDQVRFDPQRARFEILSRMYATASYPVLLLRKPREAERECPRETVTLSPLSCWEHLSPEKRELIADFLRDRGSNAVVRRQPSRGLALPPGASRPAYRLSSAVGTHRSPSLQGFENESSSKSPFPSSLQVRFPRSLSRRARSYRRSSLLQRAKHERLACRPQRHRSPKNGDRLPAGGRHHSPTPRRPHIEFFSTSICHKASPPQSLQGPSRQGE